MKKIFEKIVEGILACSGFVTSLTIVLIVVFLFSEALRLVQQQGDRRRVCIGFE